MKSFFSFCLLLFSANLSAGVLTQKVQETYQKTSSFEAHFIQKTHIELLDRDVEEIGQLVFARPGKFSIRYDGEQPRQYLCDGRILAVYRPLDKEVEIHDDVNSLVSQEALVFLGGLATMTKEFKVAESGDRLTLVPKSPKAVMKKMILSIDPKTSLVIRAELFPKSGNRSVYDFSKIRTDQAYPATFFQPPHAGVKIKK